MGTLADLLRWRTEVKLRDEKGKSIKTARGANWNAEAISITIREDEPKIDEFAVDPDAPTLEEQEKLDAETKKRELNYETKLEEYINTRTKELEDSLESLTLEDIRKIAKFEVSNLLPLSIFLQEVQDQKVFRSVYEDKLLKDRGFNTVEEFRGAHPFIKQQLINAYNNLEIGPDEVKN